MRLLYLLIAGPLFAQSGIIEVYHKTAQVPIGSTRQFTTYVSLSPNTVTWSVNDIPGGNAMVGTVSATGLYQAPPTVPMANVVTLKATSTAYANKFGTATITITKPTPWVWSVSPSTIPAGAFSIRLNGSNFIPETVVTLAGTPLATTYVSSTDVRATGTLPATQAGAMLAVRAVNPAPGEVISQAVMVTVGAAPATTVAISPTSATVQLGGTRQFSSTVTGTSNTAVTWSATAGSISSSGLYTAPATMPASLTVTVRATSVATPTVFAEATITLQAPENPPPPAPTTNLTHARFLEQAAFGPTQAALDQLQQLGINAWLDQQFALPETPILVPSSTNQARADYLYRLVHAPDQLRQRMIHALSQILVISANKNIYQAEIVPHYQNLSKHAFGNYRALLGEVTISSQMGKYLDLAGSSKPGTGSGANENFPRELLQLFAIGLWELNPDGTQKLDAQGQPIPSYTQQTVQQASLALTGWVYPGGGWEDFSGPMQPRESNHDTSAKSLLGCSIPAGGAVQQDTNAVLDCVFNHPNVGPFIATRLVRAMVTSNPTPGYVQRVAAVFNNNGAGVRGDLKATLRAILTDAEARQDNAPPQQGRLKDPIYFFTAWIRAMGGQVSPTNNYSYVFQNMGQVPLTPPSVFGFFTPLYRIPRSALFGPEFQIYTPTESVVRGNTLYQMLTGQFGSELTINLAPFQAVAGNVTQLLDLVDQRFLYGRVPAAMRTSLTNALNAAYDNNQRVQAALYLTALSGQYAVQY